MHDFLAVLTELYVMLEPRARRYGFDLKDVDLTVGVEAEHWSSWRVTWFMPNKLVRIA